MQFYLRLTNDIDAFQIFHDFDTAGFDELASWTEYYRCLTVARTGFCATLVMDDFGRETVLGIFSTIPVYTGIGRFVSFLTKESKKYLLSATPQLHQLLHQMIVHYDLHRVEADVCVEFPKYIKWATKFGFVSQGTINKYSPKGKDFIRMAYVV